MNTLTPFGGKLDIKDITPFMSFEGDAKKPRCKINAMASIEV